MSSSQRSLETRLGLSQLHFLFVAIREDTHLGEQGCVSVKGCEKRLSLQRSVTQQPKIAFLFKGLLGPGLASGNLDLGSVPTIP